MFKKKLFLAVGALMSVPLMACFGEGSQGFGFGLSRGGVNPPGEAVELDSGLKKASWTQQRPSDPQLDLLVVIDASGSLNDDFDALNTALNSFLETVVEEDLSLCVGLTIGDPDPTKVDQHLFHASGTRSVVCTDSSSSQNVAFLEDLASNFDAINFTGTSDEGGLGAFRNAITVDEIKSKYQSEGFFRDRAAISVLFMSDENDYYEANDGTGSGCADFGFVRLQPNGLAPFQGCAEAEFRFDFYSNPDGTRAWTQEDLLADVRTFQGTLAASFALIGIRNVSTDKATGFSGEITYGYNEFIDLVDGVFAPIRLAQEAAADPTKQGNFNDALKDISEGATQAAITLTVFDLPDLACAGSLEIEVAGNDVGSDKFRTSVRKIDGKDITRVVVNPSFVGESGDLIEMTYRQDDGTGSCDG